jgi:putative phage-type endonuclease
VSLTDAQREARRSGIGGSDAAAVVGRHPYTSPLALYIDKVHGRDQVESERIEAGNRLEPVIRAWAADLLGQNVSVPDAMFSHPETPVMLANVDGILADGRVLECKNIDGLQWRAADDLIDGCLPHHWYQVVHYMEVLDVDSWDLVPMMAGQEVRIYQIQRHRGLGTSIREAVQKFWENYILKGTPPPIDASDTAKAWIEKKYPAVKAPLRIAEPHEAKWLADLKDVREAMKRLEDRETEAWLLAALSPEHERRGD